MYCNCIVDHCVCWHLSALSTAGLVWDYLSTADGEGSANDSPMIPYCQTQYSDFLVKCTQSRLMEISLSCTVSCITQWIEVFNKIISCFTTIILKLTFSQANYF